MAEHLHEAEHLEGGAVTVTDCHPGKRRATVVCAAGLTGTIWKSGEALEASCSVAIGAAWHRILVEGFSVAGGGFWKASPVSLTECEGTPVV